jgi:hypothetical protein
MSDSMSPMAGPREPSDPPPRRPSKPKRMWAQLGSAGKAVVALIAAAAIGGTVYSLLVQPKIEDVIAGESRLDVRVLEPGEFHPRGLPHSGAWIFPPGGPTPDDAPSSLVHWSQVDAFNSWAADQGGIAAQTLALRLSIRANDDTPVLIHGLRVDVVNREDPIDGWYYRPIVGCGVQSVRIIQFNLDEDPVIPVQVGTGDAPRTFDQTFRITRQDPEVFEIHADALSTYVEFKLTLLYDSETGTGEYPIADGRTFAVTGIRPDAEAYEIPYTEQPEPGAKLERNPALDGSTLGC